MAVLHLPQVLYFAAFYSGLNVVFALPHTFEFVRFVWRYKVSVLCSAILLSLVVQFNTMAHPYLLADNRHYTFYIWRRIFMRHWAVKFALVPVYIYSFWSLGRCMHKADLILKLVFPVCLLVSLAPQQLLEFRSVLQKSRNAGI